VRFDGHFDEGVARRAPEPGTAVDERVRPVRELVVGERGRPEGRDLTLATAMERVERGHLVAGSLNVLVCPEDVARPGERRGLPEPPGVPGLSRRRRDVRAERVGDGVPRTGLPEAVCQLPKRGPRRERLVLGVGGRPTLVLTRGDSVYPPDVKLVPIGRLERVV